MIVMTVIIKMILLHLYNHKNEKCSLKKCVTQCRSLKTDAKFLSVLDHPIKV